MPAPPPAPPPPPPPLAAPPPPRPPPTPTPSLAATARAGPSATRTPRVGAATGDFATSAALFLTASTPCFLCGTPFLTSSYAGRHPLCPTCLCTQRDLQTAFPPTVPERAARAAPSALLHPYHPPARPTMCPANAFAATAATATAAVPPPADAALAAAVAAAAAPAARRRNRRRPARRRPLRRSRLSRRTAAPPVSQSASQPVPRRLVSCSRGDRGCSSLRGLPPGEPKSETYISPEILSLSYVCPPLSS